MTSFRNERLPVRTLAWLLALGMAGAVPPLARAEPTKPVHTRVVAANSVAIDIKGSAEQIWPILLDRRQWQPSFHSSKTMSGTAGELGEVALYTSVSNGRTSSRQEETILLQPMKRIDLALGDAITGIPTAFVSQRLIPGAGTTTVEISVYWWDDYDRHLSRGEVARLRREGSGGNIGQVEKSLARLKEAVESR